MVAAIVSGCGAPPAAVPGRSGTPVPTFHATVLEPGQEDGTPNPGTGDGDPRLKAALLTGFRDVRERPEARGAVVRMPVAHLGSLFIPMRQVASPLLRPVACARWSAGAWWEVLRRHNTPGVQLAVTIAAPDAVGGGPTEGAFFSEAIVTGPAAVLDRLGDPALPPRCRRLSDPRAGSGKVQPLAVPPLGDRTWAYRIAGSGEVPVWHWVEVVQTPRYVLEIRIPNQSPAPREDPATLLPLIAREAYAKAEAAFR